MGEKKKTMTKDEIIMELMELLKENGKAKQAAEVFECAAYVDMLENKLEKLEIKNNNIKLSFKPYEIHTIQLK